MKKLLLALILFGCCLAPAYTQDDRVLVATNDSLALISAKEVESLLATGREYSSQRLEKTIHVGDQVIARADELGLDSLYIRGCLLVGNFYRKKGDFYEAIIYLEKGLRKNENLASETVQADLLRALGISHKNLANFDKAMSYYEEALELHKRSNNQLGIASSMLNIGTILKNDNQFDAALKYYEEARSLYDQENRQGGVARSMNNIANVYREVGRYEEAEDYLKQCIELNRKLGNEANLAINLMNLGYLYQVINNYENSENYYLQSLEIRQRLGDKSGIAYCTHNLSDLYLKQNRLKRAMELMVESQIMTSVIGDKNLQMENYYVLSQIHEARGEFEEALRYYRAYTDLKEALASQLELKKITTLEYELEVGKKNQTIEQAESQNRNARLTRNLVVITLAFVSLLLILVGIGYYDKRVTNRLLRVQNEQITEQQEEGQRQNEALELKRELLENSNTKLKDLNYEKNQILGIVAHDLKSPLNAIKGLVMLINEERKNINDETSEYLSHIMQTIERMGDLIGRLLDINAIEERRIEVDIRETSVNQLLNQVASGFEVQAREKDIQIRTELPSIDIKAQLDSKLTMQVLDNLVSNAIKFSPKGKNIHLHLTETPGSVQIAVGDQGPGINPKEQPMLFSKFSKLSNRPTGNESSTGLGLYIVKELMGLMDGKVRYEDRPGYGATFVVNFRP